MHRSNDLLPKDNVENLEGLLVFIMPGTSCKKPQMVASTNKSLIIDSNILVCSFRDLKYVQSPHNDTFIVKVQISNALVSRVLVDNGSGVNIFFKDATEKMGIFYNTNMGKTTIHTFNGPPSNPWGCWSYGLSRTL